MAGWMNILDERNMCCPSQMSVTAHEYLLLIFDNNLFVQVLFPAFFFGQLLAGQLDAMVTGDVCDEGQPRQPAQLSMGPTAMASWTD